jgi:hypothetical protein
MFLRDSTPFRSHEQLSTDAPDAGRNYMKGRSTVLKLSIWVLVLLGTITDWQPFSQIAMAQDTSSDDLKIVIIAGDGFTNNIKKRTAREEIVEVRDRNNKPVSGALVIFAVPGGGPGGTFAHGVQTLTVTSNQAGRAVARIKPNSTPGQFNITVTASSGGLTATAVTISQTNALLAAGAAGAAGGISGTTIAIGVAVAAGAAVTAVTLVKVLGGGGKKATISIGPPSLP